MATDNMPFTDDELFCFALGVAPDELAQRIRTILQLDEELATAVGLLTEIFGEHGHILLSEEITLKGFASLNRQFKLKDLVSDDRARQIGCREWVYAHAFLVATYGITAQRVVVVLAQLDPAEVAWHVVLAITKKVQRIIQLPSGSTPEKGEGELARLPYPEIVVGSPDCRKILSPFVQNAARDLSRAEARHHRNRDADYEADNTPDCRGSPAHMLEVQEEVSHRVEQVKDMCTPGELRVVEALLRSDWNYAHAAAMLGVTESYLSHTISRLRGKAES